MNVIRKYYEKPFDYLIVVIFGENFDVEEAYRIPYDVVGSFPWNKHQNGIVVTVTNKLIFDPRVENITQELM